MPKNLQNDIASILIDEATLQDRIQAIAAQIDADYAEHDELLLLGVLKGSYIFMADISRKIKRPHEIDFMIVSSYGSGTKSHGGVRIVKDLKQSIVGKHVLIIEDIVDSGHTLTYLSDLLQSRSPASLKICTLLSKPSRREVPVDITYTGFEVPDEFVVGFGLDFDELYRNLPYIAILKPSVFGTDT